MHDVVFPNIIHTSSNSDGAVLKFQKTRLKYDLAMPTVIRTHAQTGSH